MRYLFLFLITLAAIPVAGSAVEEYHGDGTLPVSIAANDSVPNNFTISVFKSGNAGYGYDIFVDGKRVIHQPSIPAVPGNKVFSTKEEAKRVAELVVSKMKKGERLPAVSRDELQQLNIKLS
jgi:hypothetical protein